MTDINSDDGSLVLVGQEDVDDFNGDNILPLSPDSQAAIQGWLEPTQYSAENGEYAKHRSSRLDGTAEWLLASQSFQKWHNDDKYGILWIRGIPGSGKSVAAAMIVDRLSKENIPVLYFFFRQIIKANHEPIALLRDWLVQLIPYSPPLQVRLKEYIDSRRELESVSISDLWKDLKLGLCHLPKAYCIVDGLDEMDEGNDDFLRSISALGQWRPAQVKVLLTSRPVASVERPLHRAPIVHLRLDEMLVDADIATYVDHRISRFSFSNTDKDLIKRAIPGRANGLFLYAKLALEALLEDDEINVEKVINELPLSLDAMYTDLLHKHSKRTQIPDELQLLILSWVTHAMRPLRLLEIADMIRVTHETHLPNLGAIKDLVRKACGPLLEILPDETVSIIHHSLTEFLKGTASVSESSGNEMTRRFPILDMCSTHSRLAKTCMLYILQSKCLERMYSCKDQHPSQIFKLQQELSETLPFLTYSYHMGPFHAKLADENGPVSEDMFKLLDQFFSENNIQAIGMICHRQKYPSKLHFAAFYGVAQYAARLIQNEQINVNAKDEKGETLMLLASRFRKTAVIKVLLENGAKPDEPSDHDGLKPLHNAARNNSPEIVKMLLSAGVDPLTEKTLNNPDPNCRSVTKGDTPLMYAIRYGHAEATKEFIPYLKDSETMVKAMSWAATTRNCEVVKVILGHPLTNVNAKYHRNTPLFLAAKEIDVDSVITLLQAGADPRIRSSWYNGFRNGIEVPIQEEIMEDYGFNALHVLCGAAGQSKIAYGTRPKKSQEPEMMEKCASLMLKAGVDVDALTGENYTALRYASEHWPILVQFLVKAGANCNFEYEDGSSPLHYCRSPEAVRFLVEGGANINKPRRSDKRTPLLSTTTRTSHPGLTEMLLSLGANPNHIDSNGDGILHIFLRSLGYPTPTEMAQNRKTLETLIAAGASLNAKNFEGKTPLHIISNNIVENYFDFVSTLVAAGADVNSRDNSGQTPVWRALLNLEGVHQHRDNGERWILMSQNFAGIGARFDTVDNQGRSLLFVYLSTNPVPYVSVIESLASHSLDVNTLDYQGNSIWHVAMANVSEPNLISLSNFVSDAPRQNNLGQSIVHLCARQRHTVLQTVLSIYPTIDIDVRDHKGFRPIHVAARTNAPMVKVLLASGASPTEPSTEGITPLHVAARFKQPNITRILLKAIEFQLGKDGVVAYLNMQENPDLPSPLHIACRSRVPETVHALLDAGADPNLSSHKIPIPLMWCAQFEHQQGPWKRSSSTPLTSSGIMLDDYPYTVSFDDSSPRLEEVLSELYNYGADFNNRNNKEGMTNLDIAIESAQGKDYIVECLLRFRHHLVEGYPNNSLINSPQVLSDDIPYYAEGWLHDQSTWLASAPQDGVLASVSRRAATRRAFLQLNPWNHDFAASGDPSTLSERKSKWEKSRLSSLIEERQLDLVSYWFKQDPSLFERQYDNIVQNFFRWGLTRVVREILTKELVKRWEDEQKGSYHSGIEPANLKSIGELPLLTACRRSHRNMAMLELLVGEMGADVNAQQVRGYSYEKSGHWTSALHVLAHGSDPWKWEEGIPYLLARGADLEIRNKNGTTPLLDALQSNIKEAARQLIEAGADVNATNDSGRNCLAESVRDDEILSLLLEKGATITHSAVLSAVKHNNVSALRRFSPAIDFNIRPNGVSACSPPKHSVFAGYKKPWVPEEEKYLLYYAAIEQPQAMANGYHRGHSRQAHLNHHIPTIQALLDHGACPFAKYNQWQRMPRDTTGQDEISMEQVTLLHEVVEHSGIVMPFLDLPDLELEHRDAKGRTLLLAACRSEYGPDCSIDAVKLNNLALKCPPEDLFTGKPSLAKFLLDRGACATVLDLEQKSALHHLLMNRAKGDHSTLQLLISIAPALVNQTDTSGETPLHCTLRRYPSIESPDVRAIEILLDAGADPCALDAQGNTVLHLIGPWLADKNGEPEKCFQLFQRFLSSGADINKPNNHGETPIFSFMVGHGQVYRVSNEWYQRALDMLCNAGADIFITSTVGDTLLHKVASIYSPRGINERDAEWMLQRCQWLLDRGLDLLAENAKSQTCLDVAALCGNKPLLDLYARKP